MKKLSIIIPHYNNWEMLHELLITIPDKEEIEIIVVDDYSDDNNLKISEFEDEFPNVNFLKNISMKKGAGAARNIGLSIANGEWLLFADSDDLFIPRFFYKISSYFDSKYDLIYFIPTSFDENTQKISNRHVPYKEYITDYLITKDLKSESRLRYKFEPPWSKLIKNEVVKSNNLRFEEIMVSNDVLFSAKIGFYSKKITVSKEVIYLIREREGSLTSSMNEEKFRNRFAAWLDYVFFLRNNLSKKEYNQLNISAIPQLLIVLNNGLGLKNFIYVINNCINNSISIFDNRLLNPIFIKNIISQKLKDNVKT